MNEMLSKVFLVTLAIGSASYALLAFDFNLFAKVIPEYVTWAYFVFGAVAAYTIYGLSTGK